MKKIFLSIGLLLTVSMATVVFNSCGDDKKDEPKKETPTDPSDPSDPTDPTDTVPVIPIDTVPQTIAVTGISLDSTSLTLVIGEDYTLTATVLPDNATDKTVDWQTSDATKATISNGKVIAIAAGIAIITAKAGDKTATCTITVKEQPVVIPADGVLINGVVWAKYNVDAPGTFAAIPENAGKFYQWNSTTAWAATGTVSGWNSSWNGGFATPSSSDTWQATNNVCPTGYRLPTGAELQSLLGAGSVWTTVNGIEGRVFGSGSNSLFLPAAGYRYYTGGTLRDAGSAGFYWNSEAYNAGNAYYLGFGSGDARRYSDYRATGFSVRCVAE
ncbi:MAG: Ig-like domain-containing protein [Prevotellaceae bacterium]|jgi:uncharacterized protein (TIGR02145 family)|nr:Ig-like domain-containing protein [Prevotellaceae bacterium]